MIPWVRLDVSDGSVFVVCFGLWFFVGFGLVGFGFWWFGREKKERKREGGQALDFLLGFV
jgi:hypothetical protein